MAETIVLLMAEHGPAVAPQSKLHGAHAHPKSSTPSTTTLPPSLHSLHPATLAPFHPSTLAPFHPSTPSTTTLIPFPPSPPLAETRIGTLLHPPPFPPPSSSLPLSLSPSLSPSLSLSPSTAASKDQRLNGGSTGYALIH